MPRPVSPWPTCVQAALDQSAAPLEPKTVKVIGSRSLALLALVNCRLLTTSGCESVKTRPLPALSRLTCLLALLPSTTSEAPSLEGTLPDEAVTLSIRVPNKPW